MCESALGSPLVELQVQQIVGSSADSANILIMRRGDSMLKVKVNDIMNSEFVFVPPSAPIIEIAQKMIGSGTGIVSVCTNGRFRGVITERDIITDIAASTYNPTRERAGSLMNNHYPIIPPGEEITQAAKVMVSHGIRMLPVAQNGKLLGIFTMDDLAQESLALAAMVLIKTAKLKVLREAKA